MYKSALQLGWVNLPIRSNGSLFLWVIQVAGSSSKSWSMILCNITVTSIPVTILLESRDLLLLKLCCFVDSSLRLESESLGLSQWVRVNTCDPGTNVYFNAIVIVNINS